MLPHQVYDIGHGWCQGLGRDGFVNSKGPDRHACILLADPPKTVAQENDQVLPCFAFAHEPIRVLGFSLGIKGFRGCRILGGS